MATSFLLTEKDGAVQGIQFTVFQKFQKFNLNIQKPRLSLKFLTYACITLYVSCDGDHVARVFALFGQSDVWCVETRDSHCKESVQRTKIRHVAHL